VLRLKEAGVRTRSEEDLIDLEILDSVAGLFARLVAEGEALAKNFGFPVFVIKALHMLDNPLAMKDLGRRMHCDPSFITGIADTLEKHGLAAREPDPADRRVKRLVLTPAGADLKTRIEDEVLSRTPWRQSLSREQRASLLALIRQMSPPLSATGADCPAEEVSKLLASAAVPVPAAAPAAR
jgi:DNA-binding MarR family transcriptional regulator